MQDSSVKNKNYSFGMVGSILAKIAFLLVLFLSTSVKAGEFCSASPFFGVVDGAAGYPIPTQISIDTDCTFQNFTADNPLTATISFQTNDPSIYLIVFNNVVFTGNMACANIEHKIWFVNGSDYGSSNNCQDLFIPAETIDKQNPVGKTSVSIGEPFIYTLTLPYMNDGLGSPSPNELRNVVLFDDIAAMGVDLSFVGITAYYKGSGIPVVMVPEDQPTPTSICGAWTGTSLCYKPLSIINPGEQIIVELTLVLNDVVTNVAGLSFFNTAQWWFDRDIDIDEDGIIQPDEQFTELPGEWGISAPLLIAEPDLIVTKTSPATTLNLGISADFTIDVQNVGGSDAWDVTILDLLPDTPTAGMCDFDPTASVTAQMFAADGVTPLAGSLLPGIDYTITYSGSPTCELQFTMLSSAAVIGPSEHLIITYTSELDALPTDTGDGVDLINVAGATQWFSADEPPVGATYSRRTYARTLTDGTTTISDHEDSHLLTTGLTGYFFQKTANNLTTTQYPATFGAPGDTIQYRLRLYNIDTLFTNINITDTLNPAFFDTNTFAMVSLPPGTTYTFNNITGEFHLYGNGSPLNLTSYGEIIVEFKINLASSLVNGDTVSNQADLTSDTVSTISDDPFVNGTSAPGEASDPTVINIQTPSPALKTATQTTATIGEQVVYQITIPETPINFPLYDVKIRDNLAASATDINFVSASVVSGGSWSLTNTGTSTNVILEDIATGIDIVAGGQIVIDMTVEVQNTSNNNRGDVFDNLVSYTFNRTNGLASSQVNVVDSLPASMTLVEAELVASKTATVITPAPISGGSIIEYQISLTNNGDSTAFNINVFDTFSPYLDLNSAFTPTAQIDGAPVAGFIDIPLIEPTGEIIWGQGNGDLSLDLPAGSTLVLTYQAVVNTSTAVSFNNTAHVDWRSLDFATASERDGTGCPTITAPDDYCVTAISVTLTSVDNNSLVKSVVSDSWITDGSTANDSTVRIGDTVTYRLALSLGEGVTESVAVTDVLPAGMAFDSLVAITPASGASVFNYTLASQPANGDTGNLAWNFSTVTNNPSNDGTPNDSIVIEYVARVLPDAGITQQPSTSLTNTATLAYLDVNGVTVVDPARLQSTATITLLQPVMTNLSKVGNGVSNTMATPLNVDVANDTVAFQLQSCNVASPAAPAYDVLISDVLATQFDEVSISGLTVSIGGINATQGADYLLTLPATRGGTLQIQIIKPVLAGQCVVVDYQIGFYTDFGANQTWNNAASLGEYWSLPSSSGQQFVDGIISSFYLSNVVGATPLSKVISVPATNEVTIGDTVTYTITIPSTPVSAALSNVVLTDQLHDALTYLSASAVDLAGNPIALTDTTSGQSVNLAIAQIPAGEQAIVILQTRVANNSFANAGISFDNTASYTHADLPVPVTATSAQLNIVEPSINVNKTVSPTIAPNPGDVLTYTVTLVSDSGANFSSAFDLVIEDSLTLGMAYQAGSASITGTGNTIGEPIIAGDGVATAQTLRWDLASGTADIDVPEGATVTLTYAVDVLPSAQPGQQLTNSVVAKWTGLDGINVNERDGSGAPVENDYFSAPVTASLITQPSALSKVTSQTQVTIGETITYQITVPSIPSPTPLDNVRILDDLNGLSADLGFVSVSKISGSQPWTPVNTGDSKNLIIEDPNIGIDIPANEQVVIEIQLLVNDSAVNVNGLTFANTADYTYGATQDPGQSGTSNTTTIIEPDVLILEKTGPDTLRLGQPGTFIINVHNTGTSPAWDVTVKDQLPNPTPGGMCANAPTGITAQIFAADGITPVSAVLVQDTDYQISFLGEPDCSITFTMMSAAAAIGADQRLIISYVAEIDPDTPSNIQLTNIASATQWYSQDTDGTGATGATRTYTGQLTDGTVGVVDEQDAHTLSTELPVLIFSKTVENLTASINPASIASPGDRLRYTITLSNITPVPLNNFKIIDELDNLNSPAVFLAGSLANVVAPTGADLTNIDANGGANGTGLVDIGGLTLAAQGSVGDSITISYEIVLQPVIANGTNVLNQAFLESYGVVLANSDDPNINGNDDPAVFGDEDPTQLSIASSPIFEVFKTSDDITGDPADLVAGDILRYTIRVKNIGNDHAYNSLLKDQIPANTTYVDNSTTLNGVAVSDVATGESPLQNGLLINPVNQTIAGLMPADPDPAAANIVVVTFDVQVNTNVADGIVISNQAFLTAQYGTGDITPETPSDDPDTQTLNDPTIDIVGKLPLVDAHKTVSIQVDNGTIGQVDPGDVLRYTIVVSNRGSTDATNVVFTDAVPANTSYIADSVTLNGIAVGQPDGGVSPLINGIAISSSDLTPPVPALGNGRLTVNELATIAFDVQIDAGVAAGTVISNQGFVSLAEAIDEPTDADGIDSNGDQSTDVVVGNVQRLDISKEVFVVGGGTVEAGGELEYVIRVTNIASVAASNVVITDNLDLPVAGQMTYVANSGLLNGLPSGVTYSAPVVQANYSALYGDLPAGDTIELKFRVRLSDALTLGTTVTNIAEVSWNLPAETATASVSLDVGGQLGSINLNGHLWVDDNFTLTLETGEITLQNWQVDLYQNGSLLRTTTSDVGGAYTFDGLLPNLPTGNAYEIRFSAPNATANTASLGLANSPFTNGQQSINGIVAASGGSLHVLDLPAQPNGVVYDSVLRSPIAGAQLSMINQTQGNQVVPSSCFEDPAQAQQITTASGYYKFDLNFSAASACAEGDEYQIQVQPPATGFVGAISQIIPPTEPVSGIAFDTISCPGTTLDSIVSTAQHCETSISEVQPNATLAPNDPSIRYYLKFLFNNGVVTDQIFNNHIPLDSELADAVAISKTAGLQNVTRSQMVPYTITLTNTLLVPMYNIDIIDTFPAGFKYVANSAQLDGVASEPQINGLQLIWPNLTLNVDQTIKIRLLLVVGSGVSEGEYINYANAINTYTQAAASGTASATVRLIPDPTFDCTDVIGKVFNDVNANGYQDEGEGGIAGAQLVSARGLRITTDKFGRFHITCALVADEHYGSSFILKVDERSLPSGYRITTENPRVQRATRGKMLKFNFGATVHRVVKLDLANGVFEEGETALRPQWKSRIDLLINELKKDKAILRLSYLAENEDESLVDDRLEAIEEIIAERWQTENCCYQLLIETEVFWRKGKPSEQAGIE